MEKFKVASGPTYVYGRREKREEKVGGGYRWKFIVKQGHIILGCSQPQGTSV